MISKHFFLMMVGLLAFSATLVAEPLSGQILPKQQANPSSPSGCCVHISDSITTTPFPDTRPGVVAVSSKGCLSLIENIPAGFARTITYQIDSSNCTLVFPSITQDFLWANEQPSGLIYTPNGSCLFVFGHPYEAFFPETLSFSISDCTTQFASGNILTSPVGIAASNTCVTVAQGSTAEAVASSTSGCKAILEPISGQFFTAVAYSSDGTCLAAIDTSGNVLTFPINTSTCALESGGSTISTLAPYPVGLAFSPNGKCLVVTQSNNNVTSFSISGCTLNQQNTLPTDTLPQQIAFSPTGTCFAVACATGADQPAYGTVDIFSIDANCNITQTDTISDTASATSSVGRAVGWSPDGTCLFFFTSTDLVTASFPAPPTITITTTSPLNVCLGNSFTINALVTGGTSGFALQWYNGVTAIPGATSASLTLNNAQLLDSGSYTLVATNETCTITSMPVQVNVTNCSSLAISILCNPCIRPTDVVTYTIIVTNTGTGVAENVTVTSLLPACITFESAQNQGWTITNVGQTVTATLPVALAAGEAGSFIITGKAHCTRCQNATIISTVSAEGALSKTVSCSPFVR